MKLKKNSQLKTLSSLHTQHVSRGFTLIETFIAITILMMVIVSPLTLAQRSLSSASLTKEKMTAYFLAQDAIEYVREVRDGNILEEQKWSDVGGFLDDMSPCINNYCKADTVTGDPPILCGSGQISDCPNLTYKPATFLYGYGFTEQSPFKRGIKLTQSVGLNEVMIEATVEWASQGFGSQSIVLRDTLLDW